MEISRTTKFLMDPSTRLTASLRTTYYCRSSLMQYGLEIPCSIVVYMMSSTVLSGKLIQRYTELVVLVPSSRHQLLLLISIFPLLPKPKVQETIPREKATKAAGKKRCCHKGHQKLLWRLNYCEIEWPT